MYARGQPEEAGGASIEAYKVEVEPAAPDGVAASVPVFLGLVVLGRDLDEVLERVRVAIAFHVGREPLSVSLVIDRDELRGDVQLIEVVPERELVLRAPIPVPPSIR